MEPFYDLSMDIPESGGSDPEGSLALDFERGQTEEDRTTAHPLP